MAIVVAANGTTDDQAAATATLSDGNAQGPAEPPVDVDPGLLMAARCGDSELLKSLLLLKKKNADMEAGSASPLPLVTRERDTLLHVVAACGGDDVQKFIDCVNLIVSDVEKKKGGADAAAGAKRLALEARNSKGDTPLHCAAGAGNAQMITRLVDLMADTAAADEDVAELKKRFVKMQNDCGETALHHAVRAPHSNTACIDELMKHDPDLACVLLKDGTSPLYLAISLGKVEVAEDMYYSKSRGKLSYSGPDGRNALHAAVPRGQVLHMILGWLIKDDKCREDGTTVSAHGVSSGSQARPTTPVPATCGSSVPVAAAECLLTQLTGQRDKKQKGSTPLHLAASLEGWPHKRLLHTRFRPIWLVSRSATEGLLTVNKFTAFQADDEGSYPIHVAAHAGSLGVVKKLLERCPDCATLRDGKGRTFLHVAAENMRRGVVRYVVVSGDMPMLLNAQDNNGDTVLHCAVRAGNLAVFSCLFRNRQVRLDVANTNGMTPLDLSYTTTPPGLNYKFNPRNTVRRLLLAAGAPHGAARSELFREKHMPEIDVDKESKKHTEATQVMSIVTALIATVTFASAFTLPGGYHSDGEPTLAGSYAFDAFILADTMAFICSILATCTLVYAGFPAMVNSVRFCKLMVSVALLQSAARSLAAAFGLGLYLVVHNTVSAIAACAIVFASSIYGNMELWGIICMATTVLARIGIRRYVVVHYTKRTFFNVLIHFWSYIIIFGLPAIRKRVH